MTTHKTPQLDPTDIKLLRVFVKIVECGGFAGAQAELNISPSTISTQIAKLETRLGVRLCQRGRVGFRLTDKGRGVYQAATRLFSAIDDFRSDVGEVRGKLAGSLRIGVVDTTVSNPEAGIARAIARFSGRDHAVHITLHIGEPATLERWLLDGRIDVGISAFYHHVPGLNYEPIFTEEHGLFCGRDHPLFEAAGRADPGRIRAADYVMRGYIPPRHANPLQGMHVAATAYDMEAIAILVLSGAYIGHLPTHYAAQWVARGEMAELRPDLCRFRSRFEVATRRGASRLRVLDAFLEDVRRSRDGDPRGSPPGREARRASVAPEV